MLCKAKGHGFCSANSDRVALESSRQTGPLHQHLEGVNKGQLGIRGCQGLPNFPCREACTGEEAMSVFISARATSPNTGEISSLLEKEAVTEVDGYPLFRQICSVSGPQEEWENETSNQPQSLQSVGVETPHLKMTTL